MTLGQLDLGDALKQQGMALADAAASVTWKDRWDDAIEQLAATGQPFSADEVREIAGAPEDHVNATGTRFLNAARRGLIIKVGYRNSTRAVLHSHPIAEWVGR